MHLFCFGLGYVSSYIINDLGDNYLVSGSHTGKKPLNLNEYIFNDNEKFNPEILRTVTHILISIPPNSKGDPVFLAFINEIRKLEHLKWIGYFSSTSVYGDHQGRWVDENSYTDPTDPLGKNRLIAEGQWLESGLPVNIFRIAAIYGEGRSVLDSIRSGRAVRIFKENHFFSRIHVRDISQIIRASFNSSIIGEIFNLADDLPSMQHEVVEFGYKLLGLELPEMVNYEEAKLSEMAKRYYNASKKINNNKVKDSYKISLMFPSYKEGLSNLF